MDFPSSAGHFDLGLDDETNVSLVYLAIDQFSKLCAVKPNIDGAEIYEQLNRRFGEFLPEEAQTVPLPRVGFLYVLDETFDAKVVKQFIQQLINATKSPLEIDNETLEISISVGVARGFNERTGKPLLDRAQFAQYCASRRSGSTFEFYDNQEAREAWDELSLKNDFFPAIERDEFFLQFQPVVSLEDYTPVGAEALVRWRHPERGPISPGVFIPLAERTGKILFLDRWVLEHAIRQAETWYETLDIEFELSINVSAWQFRDDFLIEKLKDLLSESSFPPRLLKIEVTETSMMQDVDRTARVLRSMKDLGVKIALDDFGTGHATFEYLSQFPIDELKIDRTFLNFDDIYSKNQKLVDIMIQTGERIDSRILAEGVETSDQLDFVRNRGCQFAQGFLFARPMEGKKFEGILKEKKALFDGGPTRGTSRKVNSTKGS